MFILSQRIKDSHYSDRDMAPEVVSSGSIVLEQHDTMRFIVSPATATVEVSRDLFEIVRWQNPVGDLVIDIAAPIGAAAAKGSVKFSNPGEEDVLVEVYVAEPKPCYVGRISGFRGWDNDWRSPCLFVTIYGYVNEELFGPEKLPIHETIMIPSSFINYTELDRCITFTDGKYPRLIKVHRT